MANHYWVYLDEREEVLRQLGVEVPRHGRDRTRSTDEITLTETAEVGATRTGGFPEADSLGEGDQSLSSQPAAKPTDHERNMAYPGIPDLKPMATGRAEEGVWRVVGTLLIVFTSGLVIWIIRILQTSK